MSELTLLYNITEAGKLGMQRMGLFEADKTLRPSGSVGKQDILLKLQYNCNNFAGKAGNWVILLLLHSMLIRLSGSAGKLVRLSL